MFHKVTIELNEIEQLSPAMQSLVKSYKILRNCDIILSSFFKELSELGEMQSEEDLNKFLKNEYMPFSLFVLGRIQAIILIVQETEEYIVNQCLIPQARQHEEEKSQAQSTGVQ